LDLFRFLQRRLKVFFADDGQEKEAQGLKLLHRYSRWRFVAILEAVQIWIAAFPGRRTTVKVTGGKLLRVKAVSLSDSKDRRECKQYYDKNWRDAPVPGIHDSNT